MTDKRSLDAVVDYCASSRLNTSPPAYNHSFMDIRFVSLCAHV